MFCSIWEALCVTLNWKHLDMVSGAQRTGSPLAHGVVSTPTKVCVQGDKLLYLKEPEEVHRVDGNILRDFIGLRSGDIERNIITFAKKYGTLKLCEHGRPMFHNQEEEPPDAAHPWGCREVPSSVVGWDFEERLATWKSFSLQAQALWNTGEALRRDRRVADADLDLLGSDAIRNARKVEQMLSRLPRAAELQGGAAASFPQFLIRSTLRRWLRFGGVEIQPFRRYKVWSLEFSNGTYNSTFGAIAVHLLLEIVGAPTLAVCKGCASLFAPARRVDRNRDHFCGSKNGQREAWRLSKEARRRGRRPLWTRPDLAERNRRRSPKRLPETGNTNVV